MLAHSRPRDGVASLAYVAGIHDFPITVHKTYMAGTMPGHNDACSQRYCKLSATKRVSPSGLETSSTATFFPWVLSCSMRLCRSVGLPTAWYCTSTMTSPGDSRLSGAAEATLASTLVTTTPLTLSRT